MRNRVSKERESGETARAAGEPVTEAKKARKGAVPGKRRKAKSDAELLDEVMEKIEDTLVVKPSVGDLLRVMQARKEVQEPPAREIKVQWVEPEGPAKKR